MEWYESLGKQAETLLNILKQKDAVEAEVEKLISLITHTNGIVYFTGIGKSGLVAAKVSSTYNSLGIRSFYIDAIDTLHGDMGIFTNKDLVIFISKSGETKELFPLFDELRLRNIRTVAITSNGDSYLAKNSDFKLVLPIKSEGDFLNNLVPLASTITYEAILQAIAVEIASERGFSLKDFIHRHPGGKIGQTEVK